MGYVVCLSILDNAVWSIVSAAAFITESKAKAYAFEIIDDMISDFSDEYAKVTRMSDCLGETIYVIESDNGHKTWCIKIIEEGK